jgi:uncharacterized protein YcfL
MKTHYTAIAPILLCLTLAACGAPRGTAANTFRGKEGDTELETIAGNPRLLKNLEVVRYQTKREDDRLRVQFDLQNKKASNLAFEWSVDWFDASGFRIDTQEHWTPIVLGGKAFKTISITGPTPAASVFQLMTRTPNTVR